MPLNETDEALENLEPSQGLQIAEPVDIAQSIQDENRQALKRSVYTAKVNNTEPDRQARILGIAKKEGVDPNFVARNFEFYTDKKTWDDAQYEELQTKTPALAKWLQKPENVNLSQGDLEPLANIDNSMRALTIKKPETSLLYLPSEMAEAAQYGYYDMEIGANLNLGMFGDAKSRPAAAKAIAERFRRQEQIRAAEPDYTARLSEAYEKQRGDVSLAFYRALNGWKEFRYGMVLQGLQDMAFGGTMTLGESIEMLKLLRHVPAMAYESSKVAASSAPAIFGAVAGGLATKSGAGTGVGTYVGTKFISTSGRARELLQKKGVDFSDEQSILNALNDESIMKDVRSASLRGGEVEGILSGLFAGVAGKSTVSAIEALTAKEAAGAVVGKGIASKAASIFKVAKGFIKDTFREMGGEIVEGAGGDIAQEKGDLASVDIAKNIYEGVMSVGPSTTHAATGAVSRGAMSAASNLATIAKANETTKNMDASLKAIDDAQHLKAAQIALSESQTNKLSKDSAADLVNIASSGDPNAKVYFQPADWEAYFKNRSLSPIETLERISESGVKSYNRAQESGGLIEIPLRDFIVNSDKNEHFDELLKIARTDPSAKSLLEAATELRNLPDTVQALVQEVIATPEPKLQAKAEPVTQLDQQMADIERITTERLVAAGEKATTARQRAKLLGSFLRSAAERSGTDITQLVDKYKLNVSRGTSSETAAPGTTLEQPAYHGSPHVFDQFSTQKIGTGEGAQAYGWGLYFTDEKAIAEYYREGLKREGAQSSLFKVEIPENEDFLDYNKPLTEQSEKVQKVMREDFGEDFERGRIFQVIPSKTGKTFEVVTGSEAQGNFYGRYKTQEAAQKRADFLERRHVATGELAYRRLVNKTGSPEAASRYLASKGIAGIRYESPQSRFITGKPSTNFVIFDENLIKVQERVLYQREQTAEPFYSQLQRTLDEKISGSSATVEQVRALLRGLKPEEVKWSGIEDYLKGKTKVDKAELLAYLRANELQIEEVTKGQQINTGSKYALPEVLKVVRENPGDDLFLALSNDGDAYRALTSKFPELSTNEDWVAEVISDLGLSWAGEREPKFAKWQLPGGENYRELLLRMPPTEVNLEQWKVIRPDGHVDSTYASEESAKIQAERRGVGYTVQKGETKQLEGGFRSSHFDEPNILAHVRFNDRTDAQGNRVLFLEEVQSDWHQRGRKIGYQGDTTNKQATTFRVERADDGGYNVVDENGQGWAYASDRLVAEQRAREFTQRSGVPEGTVKPGVPDAPFRKTWHEFALKRMIRYAAENGYDKIAWTTGEQQAERYDLSKQVEDIIVQRTGEDKYDLFGNTTDRKGINIAGDVSGNELADYIGKDLAEKIRLDSLAIGEPQTYTGNDLKVGGEGMKGFYDQILPKAAEKLAGKFDKSAKVTDEKVGKAGTVHALPITDKLRDGVMSQGFSLFQRGEGGARGRITIAPDRSIDIQLLEKADASTFFHELGHAFLEITGDLAELETATPQLKQDFKALLDWFGVESRDQITTEHHEKFARGFETFLYEGKAPSKRLRDAFHNFRMWLIGVYKGIVNLNVTLTPEVRGVMERMLATDAELTKVAQERKMHALFADVGLFGFTGDLAEKYVTMIAEAEKQSIQEFQAKMFENYRREKRRFLDKERARIRKEIEGEYNATPQAVAAAAVINGKLPDGSPLPYWIEPVKLNRSEFTKRFGKEVADQMPKGTFGRDGIDGDTAAALVGLESAQQLRDALLAEAKREETVDFLVATKIGEEYGDLLAQADMSEEAYESLQNDARGKLLQEEMRIIAQENLPMFKEMIKELTRRPIITESQVKEYADSALGDTVIADIKPRKFEVAELKSGTLSGEALAKGDRDAAYIAKRNQLINHQLYKRAIEIEREVRDAKRKFKDVWKKDEDLNKSRDIDYINTARALLAAVGLGRSQKTPMDYLASVKAYDPSAYETLAAMISGTLEQTNGRQWNELTYDEFSYLKRTYDALWQLSKSSKEITLGEKTVAIDEAIERLNAQVVKNIPQKQKSGKAFTPSESDKVAMAYESGKSKARIVESWADEVDRGDSNGAANEIFVKTIQEAAAKYHAKKKTVLTKIRDIFQSISKTFTPDVIPAPELGGEFRGLAEVFGAMLHVGNESNFQKLLRGRGWGDFDESGVLDTSRWRAFIERMHREGKITKAHWDAVQAIWDTFEELKPDLQKAHKKMTGMYFNEVTAKPFTTPFGEYRGGYMPARSDPFEVARADINEQKDILAKEANFALPTAGRGATKNRIEAYAAPLSLNARIVMSHADWALRYAFLEPTVREVARVTTDKRFRATMESRQPQAIDDMLIPYLQRTVQQRLAVSSGTSPVVRAVDAVMTKMRRNAAFAVMFGNVANAAQQLTGLSVAATKAGITNTRNAMWQYIRHPKASSDFVTEKSQFMNTRLIAQAIELQRQVEDFIVNPTKYEKAKDWAYGNAYFLQSAMQGPVDTVTWMASYDKAISEGMTEEQAIFAADKAVRVTQGSSAPQDVSQFIASTPIIRALLMFQNYNNTIGNLLVTETRNEMREVGLRKGFGRLATTYTLALMVPAIMSAGIRMLASGKFDQDDDDEYLDDAIDAFLGEPVKSAVGMIPGVGPYAQAAVNKLDNKWYNDRIRMSPAIDAFDAGTALPAIIWRGIRDGKLKKQDIKDALTAINVMFATPVGPLGRPLGYWASVSQGKTKPKNTADFIRGLIVGR